jgi:hypothetical protein
MPEQNEQFDEEQLRQEIRAEIKEREEALKARQDKLKVQEPDLADRKRKLYQEELRNYYQQRPDYREIIRDNGEVDWVPKDDVTLFDDVLEDPAEAKKRQKLFILITLLFAISAGLVIFLLLNTGSGSVKVVCNIPDAKILLDAASVQQKPGEPIPQVSAGDHVISVAKEGFHLVGPQVQKFSLKNRQTLEIKFTLEPDAPVGNSSKDKKL